MREGKLQSEYLIFDVKIFYVVIRGLIENGNDASGAAQLRVPWMLAT